MVIATHGTLANGLLAAAEMIVGTAPDARAVNFEIGMSVDDLTNAVNLAIEEIGGDDPVLVLVDLAGGSPSRVAATLALDGRTKVLAGVNLPMVIAALTEEDADLPAIVAAGRAGIDMYGNAPAASGGLR